MPNDPNHRSVNWEFHDFDSLSTSALFALMKLRVDVFVVEQACAYPELDTNDTAPGTIHLLGYVDNELAAYARAMPGGSHSSAHSSTSAEPEEAMHPPVRIGRVVIAGPYRGRGLATALMQQLMVHLHHKFPDRNHCLAAQTSVKGLYAALGFEPVSDEYLEDGIAHIDMVRLTD